MEESEELPREAKRMRKDHHQTNTAAVSQPEAMLGKPTSTRPGLKCMACFPSAQITAELVSADPVVLHF